MMTTYRYKTSFSAAFQGAIDGLGIFRRTENCRSNRFGVTQILGLGDEQQKDLGSARSSGVAAHFSNGTTSTIT